MNPTVTSKNFMSMLKNPPPLSEILERISDAFIMLDKDWCYTYVNKKAGEIMHRNPGDLIGKYLLTEYPEFKNQPLYHAYQKAIAGQQYVYFEEFCEPFNAWFENHIHPSHDGLTIYYRDITERKKSDEKLAESESKYSILEENIHEALIIEDAEGNLVYANKAFRKIFGYEPGEPLYITLKDYTAPQSYKAVIERHNNRMNGMQAAEEFEYKGIRKDGTEIWLEASVSTMMKNGKIIGTRSLERDITERKNNEKIISKSENQLKTIFQAGPECIKLLGPANELLEMNFAGLAIIEADSMDQVRNVCILPLVNENYRNAFAKLTADVFDGKSGTLEFELTGLKGTKRWLETHAVPLKDADGNVSSLLAVTRDITERNKAELALKASEEKYRHLFERNLAGVYQSKLNGEIITCNDAFARMLGYDSKQELHMKDAYLLYFSNTDRENFITYLREKGELTNYEKKMKKKDGSPTYIIENCTLQTQSLTGEEIIQGVMIDITSFKNAEAEIIAIQERFRTLYEENPLMNFTLDADGKILSLNRRGATDLGYNHDELIGNSILRVFFPKDHTTVLNQIKECISNPGKSFSWEMRKLTKDGKTIWVSETGTALPDTNGNYLVMIVCENITDRKKVAIEIAQMNEQLHNLTAHLENIREEERTNIAREIHDELGQQLTGIHMDLAIIHQEIASGKNKNSKSIPEVIKAVDDALKSVRKISSELRPFILDDLGLLAAMESHCHEFGKRFGIACNCNSTIEELLFEKTFATGVFRIFQESLTNIARHSKATSIKCSLKQDGNQLELSIKDNGTGFTINNNKEKSLGIIGMKERATMLGGNLTIESAVGIGTQIILTAPIRLQSNV